jgi:phasin family protein
MSRKPTAVIRPPEGAAPLTVIDDSPVLADRTIDAAAPIPMINSTNDFVAFSKDNLEAFTAAGKIWAAGVQDLTQQVAATAKASLEESVATFKALGSVKSVQEAIDLQSTYSKAAVAKAVAESTKLTEASLKLTEQALAPLTARMAVAVGAFGKAA